MGISWLSYESIGGSSLVILATRFGWRRLTRPGTPSLIGRFWRWTLLLGQRELENQQLRTRLDAALLLNQLLVQELERLVGAERSRSSRPAPNPAIPSNTPTPPSET